ncbi:hypothetical protein SNE40_016645 [Patella caerulea]|uniref:Methyltransferase type 11 domain-containing protein n=1 Tax=Patella caerulea TaxID=87958 RepID=A0AAN8PE95_PATCE
MAVQDFEVKTIFFYYLFPVIALLLLLRVLKYLKPRLLACGCNAIGKRIHAKCATEKEQLFRHLDRDLPHHKLQILEIGAGSGLNFKFYPEGSEITSLDPNQHHKKYIETNRDKLNPKVHLKQFVCGFAEDMSCFDNESFDVVVETFVLCSVRNTEKVLQEVKRVLKPGGKFFFMDHVAAEHSSSLRWFQNRLNPLWKAAADDCHINREIASTINKIGFSSVEVNQFNLNTFIVLIKPSIYGTSVK